MAKKRKPGTMPPAFDGNFTQLVREMAAAARELDALPDDQEWTQDGLVTLDNVRHAALNLAHIAEVTIEAFEGGKR